MTNVHCLQTGDQGVPTNVNCGYMSPAVCRLRQKLVCRVATYPLLYWGHT